jgi:HK97 family phage major capsid protein
MTPDHVKRAYAARMRAVEELRALDAAAEGREFTAEEAAKEAAINDEIRRLDAVISDGLDSLAKAEQLAAAVAKFGAGDVRPERRSAEREELRSFVQGKQSSVVFMPATYEERAAMNKGTPAEGGYLVPVTMYDQIVKALRDLSVVLEAGANVLSTASGEDITVPRSDAFPSAAIVSEGAAYGTSDSTFGQVTLRAYKYGFISTASEELLNDSAFDVEAYVAEVGGEALAHAMGGHFVVGTGTGQPQGVLHSTAGVTTGHTLATAGVITADQIIDIYHSVPRPYRASASWLMSDELVKAVRKLKTVDNQYLWQPGMAAGTPDTLLGRPVLTDPAVPAFSNTAGLILGGFGDWRRAYTVRIAGGVRIDRSTEYAFANGQVAWRFSVRADGRIVDTNAARKFKNP